MKGIEESMRTLNPVVILLAAGLLLPAYPAASQLADGRLSVEFRAGALVPVGDWDVRDRETALRAGAGPALAGLLRFEVGQGVSVYGAYRWARPSCEDCGLFALDENLGDAGFGFGVGYVLPAELPLELRVDAGALSHQLSFRGDGDSRPSNWGLGGELGITGSIELGPSLFLEPGASGATYPARFDFEEGEFREVTVRYLMPRVGLRYRF